MEGEVLVTADPALLIEPEPLPSGALKREGMDKDRRLIGMSVREPGKAAPDVDEETYHAVLANAADFMVDCFDAHVVLVPMEHLELDTQHSHAVLSRMLRAPRAVVLKEECTPRQLLSLIGRADGLVQLMTLMFRMAEFAREAIDNYVREHPDQWRSVHGLWDLIAAASRAGELHLPREDILLFATPHPREVSVNSTRVTGVRGIDVWDLTYAEWRSRRQMRQIAAFLVRYVPGFREAYIVQSGVQIGVRETRRILGDYVLTGEDILAGRRFDDVVARCSYPIDIHNPTGPGTVFKRVPPGEAYDIPLRALLPRKIDRLLVAGRCISGTHEALSSYRVMPVAMVTGRPPACAPPWPRLGGPRRGMST